MSNKRRLPHTLSIGIILPSDIKLLLTKLYLFDPFHLHDLVQVKEYGLVPFGEFFFHSSLSVTNWVNLNYICISKMLQL